MARQPNELGHGRRAERRPGVNRPASAGSDVVGVRARLGCGRHARWRTASVDGGAKQVELRGIVGRGRKVNRAFVRPQDEWFAEQVGRIDDVEGARRYVARGLAIARHDVQVAPTIPLTHPGKILSTVEPAQIVHDIDPGAVALDENGLDGASARVAEVERECILKSIEMLEDDFGGLTSPVHPCDVSVAWITGNREPLRRPTARADHADARRRVGCARLRVLHRYGKGVERIGIVDEEKVMHPGDVELPVGDPRAVGAPTKAVAQRELLLVHPIEGAVDARRRAVSRQAGDALRRDIEALDVQVVLAHVGYTTTIR